MSSFGYQGLLAGDPTYTSSFKAALEDDDTEGLGVLDALETGVEAVGITAVTALTSLGNTGVAVGNFFGADIDEFYARDYLSEDLEDRYLEDKSTYDLAGDIVGGLLPGGLAVTAAKRIARGSKGIGRFFDDDYYSAKHRALARTAMRETKQTGTFDRTDFALKTTGLGAQRGLAEGIIFETAAYAGTMLKNDINNDDLNAFDVALRIGSAVAVGGMFNSGLNALGSVAVRTNAVGKRLKSGKLDTPEFDIDELHRAAPKGSQLVHLNAQVDAVAKLKGDNLDAIANSQPAIKKQEELLGSMVGKTNLGAPHHEKLRRFVTDNTSETISNALTGVISVTPVRASKLRIISREAPAFIVTEARKLGIDVNSQNPVAALKKLPKTQLSKAAAKFYSSGQDQQFMTNEIFLDLDTGAMVTQINTPRLADLGLTLDNVHVGHAPKDHNIKMPDGKVYNSKSEDVPAEYDRVIKQQLYLGKRDSKMPIMKLNKADGRVRAEDIDLFEAAYFKAVRHQERVKTNPGLKLEKTVSELVTEAGGINRLGVKIVNAKRSRYNELAESGADANYIEQKLGIKDFTLQGPIRPSDYLTLDKTDYFTPRYVRAKVEANTFSLRRQEAENWERYNNQMYDLLGKRSASRIMGMAPEQLPKFPEDTAYHAVNAGAGLFNSAVNRGLINSPEQVAAAIGKNTNTLSKADYRAVLDKTEHVFAQMLNPEKAAAHREWLRMEAWYEGIEGKVVLDDFMLHAVDTGEQFVFNSVDTFRWAQDYHNAQIGIAEKKFEGLKGIGRKPNFDADNFYIPPKDIKFGLLVYAKDGLAGNNRVGIVRANTNKELKELTKQMEKDGKYTLRSLTDVGDFYKASGDFDISRSFSLQVEKDAFAKKGLAKDLKPNLDPNNTVTRLNAYFQNETKKNQRRAVNLFYSKEVSMLNNLHEQQLNAGLTKSAALEAIDRFQFSNTPALNTLKTMLDIPPDSGIELLSVANKSFEKYVSHAYNRVANKFNDLTGRTEKRIFGTGANKITLDQLNKSFGSETGIKFDSVNEAIVAAHPDINTPKLQRALSTANGIQAALMLRADGIDGLVNNMSYAIMSSPIVKDLVKQAGEEKAGKLKKLLTLSNGDNLEEISVMKSWLRGTADIGSGDYMANRAKWKEMGIWDDIDDVYDDLAEVMDAWGKAGFKNPDKFNKEANGMFRKAMTGGKKVAYAISDTANNFAQYQTIKLASDIARTLELDEGGFRMLAHTLKGRLLGMNIPSQKPSVFQGAIGTPIGLYQNYNLNVINAMSKFAGNGSLPRFAALQTGYFGLQGLPGFETLNTAVHDHYGKSSGQDLKSITQQLGGEDLSSWALYGSGSFIFDAALYSRGDLNPRNRFIIPTQLDEIPAYGALSRAITNGIIQPIEDIRNGASPVSAFLDGIAHTGLNRPLTNLIEAGRGYNTTLKGGKGEDLPEGSNPFSLDFDFARANVSRLLGARPFDEALIRERNYRLTRYTAESQANLNRLGATLKREMLSTDGNISQETANRFMERYFQSGRTPEQFEKWFANITDKYDDDRVERLERRIKNSPYYTTFQSFYDRAD